MAHSKSAQKRIRQNENRKALNRWRKQRIKDDVKDFRDLTHSDDVAKAAEALKKASRSLDQIASKGTIHKNTAARRKSRLAKQLNQMQAKG